MREKLSRNSLIMKNTGIGGKEVIRLLGNPSTGGPGAGRGSKNGETLKKKTKIMVEEPGTPNRPLPTTTPTHKTRHQSHNPHTTRSQPNAATKT